MRQIVSDVREPGAARLEAIDEGESLLHGLVHGMGNISQGVQDEFVETFKQGHRGIRQNAEISEIGSTAKTETRELPFRRGAAEREQTGCREVRTGW